MSIRPSKLRLGVMSTALWAALPVAYATSYYCDNDPSTSQYPNCFPGSSSGTYYSGQAHDVNGDDRRLPAKGSSQNCPTGIVGFKTAHAYTWSVWLYNDNFRSTNTSYNAINGNLGTTLSVKVNQNTAPGGWKVLGKSSGSSQLLVIGNCGSSAAGVDATRGSFTTSNIVQPALAGTQLSDNDDVVDTSNSCGVDMATVDPQVAAIQRKMLTAVDHYKDISGRFRIMFTNAQQDDAVTFQASEKSASSTVSSIDAQGSVTQDIANGSARMSLWPGQRAYQSTAVASTDTAAIIGPRYYHNAQCQPVFRHREDPAHAFAANDVTSPENYAFWLSTSTSRIIGSDTLLGRKVTVIRGQQDAYLAHKLGAATFTMWVDDATGVLLKLAGTNAGGRTVYSIDVSSLSIDSGVKPNTVSLAVPPTGWTKLDDQEIAMAKNTAAH